jgi:hypothetical protein
MNPQAVNSALAELAAYQAANPNFNPATATQMPSGVSLDALFTPPPNPPIRVPVAPNVALITDQAYVAGLATQQAAQMLSEASSLSSSLQELSSANSNVTTVTSQSKPLPYPYGQPNAHAYLYGLVNTDPYQNFDFSGYTLVNIGYYLNGPRFPSNWTWEQEISSLTPTTFYVAKTATITGGSLSPYTPVPSNWWGGNIVGDPNVIGVAISADNQAYGLLTNGPAFAQAVSNADTARQSALAAVVQANQDNAVVDSSEANTARRCGVGRERFCWCGSELQ